MFVRTMIQRAIDQQVGSTPLGDALRAIANELNSLESSDEFSARAVVTALPNGTFSGGTFTATPLGALASQDGVSLAEDELVLIQESTTNLANNANAGPYLVVQLGTLTTPTILSRPSWWAHGSIKPAGSRVNVASGGTLYGNTEWKTMSAMNVVVGTDAPNMYPNRVVRAVQLAAGAFTITNIPIFSARTTITVNRTTPIGTVLTAEYGVDDLAPFTPGHVGATLGTGLASLMVIAQIGAGTINVDDTSFITVEIRNWLAR